MQQRWTNTKRKTKSDIRIFKDWISTVGELRNTEGIEVEEITMHLARFFLSARSKSKQDYEPGDRFTKVIVNRKFKITLKISLRARIRAFH